jgi:hypothetical protein
MPAPRKDRCTEVNRALANQAQTRGIIVDGAEILSGCTIGLAKREGAHSDALINKIGCIFDTLRLQLRT